MNWFSQNKFLAGFLVILVIALGGAGYYLMTAHGKYAEAMTAFSRERDALAALERKQLYPSAENVSVIEAEVKDYQQKVLALQEKLLKFQKPLNREMSDTEFPNFLKERIEKFQSVAASKNVQLPADFYMGFPAYRATFPRPPAVGLLHYEALAIEAMLMKLVAAAVDAVVALEREPLAIEADGYEAPKAPPVLEKYAIELTISGNHEAVREFFNQISNDAEYFYNIRFVRIENSAKEGPRRGAAPVGAGAFMPDENAPAGVEPDAPFDPFGAPAPGDPGADPEAANDAVIVMGQEKIQVFMVIDVVRFIEIGNGSAGTEGTTGSK